jgi:hypothetical protein
MGLRFGLRGTFVVQPAMLFEWFRSRASGARRGARRDETDRKNRARVYLFIFPKVCPAEHLQMFSRSRPAPSAEHLVAAVTQEARAEPGHLVK